MLRCREVSKLVSESLDHPLPWGLRWRVRLHLMMCRLCAGFARALRRVRRAARRYDSRVLGDQGPGLSDEARERIKQRLRERGRR